MAKDVFLSFHYQRDHWRVQQIRNMGAIDEQPILSPQDWESVKSKGDQAIKNWIAEKMKGVDAVVVLVGAQTSSRPWVKYEIGYAWDNYKPLVGVRIHGLEDQQGHPDSRGADPFANVSLKGGGNVSDYVPLHEPSGANSQQVYASISKNLTTWVDNAYKRK